MQTIEISPRKQQCLNLLSDYGVCIKMDNSKRREEACEKIFKELSQYVDIIDELRKVGEN